MSDPFQVGEESEEEEEEYVLDHLPTRRSNERDLGVETEKREKKKSDGLDMQWVRYNCVNRSSYQEGMTTDLGTQS